MRNKFFLTSLALVLSALPPVHPLSAQGPSAPDTEPPSGSATFAFVGDVLLDRSVGEHIKEKGVDYPWLHAASLFSDADFVIANLETSVATSGRPMKDKQFTFRAHPSVMRGVSTAGVDLVSLANNHTLDFGEDALLETIENVRSHGVLDVGAGATVEEAESPRIVYINGLLVGIIGYSRVIPVDEWDVRIRAPGMASGYDDTRVIKSVLKLRPEVDVVIVLLHWGRELWDNPRDIDYRLAQSLKAAGADIVVGGHPHVLQGFEFEDKSFVSYSLGNFVFTDSRASLPHDTGVLFIEASKEGVERAWFEPMRLENGQPRPAQSYEKNRILSRLGLLSQQMGTEVSPEGEIRSRVLGKPVER